MVGLKTTSKNINAILKVGFWANFLSGVNKSARERIGRQNLSQKFPSKKGSLGVIFSPRNDRENAHSKSANFEGRHSGGHLLGRPLLFTSDFVLIGAKKSTQTFLYKVFQEPFESWTSAPKIVDVRTKKCVFLRPRWWGETFRPLGIRA